MIYKVLCLKSTDYSFFSTSCSISDCHVKVDWSRSKIAKSIESIVKLPKSIERGDSINCGSNSFSTFFSFSHVVNNNFNTKFKLQAQHILWQPYTMQQIEDDIGLNANDAWRIADDRKSWRALPCSHRVKWSREWVNECYTSLASCYENGSRLWQHSSSAPGQLPRLPRPL